MEIGISTASFYPMQTEDTIKIISDMESSLCEVFLEAEYEYGKEFIRELKKELPSKDETYDTWGYNGSYR